LLTARAFCEQFNFETVIPVRLSWQEQYSRRGRLSQDRHGNPLGPRVTPHYPLLDKGVLILNPVLHERLSVEEWRPLIASSVIFYGRLRKKLDRLSALLFAPTLLLLAVFLLGLLLRGLLFSGLLPLFILAGLIIVTGIVGGYSSLLLSRKSMLLADKTAADMVGAQPMLEALRKIQSLRDSDERDDRMFVWAWVEYGDAPSIERRIRNLQQDIGES
jgi:hypothetical protein